MNAKALSVDLCAKTSYHASQTVLPVSTIQRAATPTTTPTLFVTVPTDSLMTTVKHRFLVTQVLVLTTRRARTTRT